MVTKLNKLQGYLTGRYGGLISRYHHMDQYLPNYLTLEYPEVRLREGSYIFSQYGPWHAPACGIAGRFLLHVRSVSTSGRG
jgi:hypothetical protein